jgi:hypothetical protein
MNYTLLEKIEVTVAVTVMLILIAPIVAVIIYCVINPN